MTIYREGKAIELTRDEMYHAYREIKSAHMREDIENRINDNGLTFESFAKFDFKSEEAFRDSFIQDCFDSAEDYIYQDDYDENYAIDLAIGAVADDYDMEYNY